jgi:hypothetical protein
METTSRMRGAVALLIKHCEAQYAEAYEITPTQAEALADPGAAADIDELAADAWLGMEELLRQMLQDLDTVDRFLISRDDDDDAVDAAAR